MLNAIPAQGQVQEPEVTIAVDPASNSLIVVGSARAVERVHALIQQIQQQMPVAPGTIRYITLPANVDVQQLNTLLTQTIERMTPRGGQPGDLRQRVGLIADVAGNALIVAANDHDFETVADVIAVLSKPVAEKFPVRTVTLQRADVAAVARAIQQFYDDRAKLTGSGRAGGPQQRRVAVAAIDASNTLLISATDEEFAQIESLIEQFDTVEATAALTFRVFQLQHARAPDIERTVQNLVNDLIWNQGDRMFFWNPWMPQQQQQQRKDAIAVRADPRLNALIVTGRGDKFEVVEQMIQVLDAAPPQGEQKLVRLYRLQHAPLQTVADTVRDMFNQGRQRRPWEPPDPNEIRVRVDDTSNMVIIAATAREHDEIRQVIASIDEQTAMAQGEAGGTHQTQIMPVKFARASEVAASLTRFLADRARAANAPRPSTTIVPSDTASTLLVAGPPGDLEMVRELLGQLDQATTSNMAVHVLKLESAPAARIHSALNEAYQVKARQSNQPLTMKVDPASNSLIIASTQAIFDEISQSAAQLDAIAPASGQAIFIIELQNIPPETARSVIETIGLDKPQPADSTSRIVSEPVKVSLLAGRSAIVVVANPADRETVVGLLKAIDSEPQFAEAQTRIVRLRHAQAAALAQILTQMLKPADQQAETSLARAVREQVRRLAVSLASDDPQQAAALSLDLAKPIRVVADPALNALVISSTAENVGALEQVIAMFDQLPISETVTVQIFPLQNIAAEQFARIVREMFAQGKQLGRNAMTRVQAVPEGAVGKALLHEIAISVDERTNTVIVAGNEDSVALVEVLSKRIDSQVGGGWVEPRVLALQHADAASLATTLQAILVDGVGNLPQSTSIQRQVGRLRLAKFQPNGEPANVVESDVFTPMSRLVIRADTQMNALILVGTPANIDVVSELVAMLDIDAASPANAVRIYPVDNASAARLAQTIRTLFDQQIQSKAIRQEDRVIIQADERTNALVVATSSRSFAVVESLLKTLDSKLAPELREIRTIEVKNASATRLAGMIQQMMDARMERLRRTQPETADLERATVVADARTNSLIVAAGNDSFEVIARLASDLDVSTLGDAALVHVLPVEKANIDRVASTINQIMERRYADMPGDIRRSQRPLVLTDSRTNSLLVAANPEDLASIEDLVKKLSVSPTNPAVGVHLVTLPLSTRAEIIAPRVQRLMADRQASLGAAATAQDKVSVEADPSSNSLIVAANEENLEVIRNLVDILVQAELSSGTGRELEIISLSSVNRAADMVDMLNHLYVQEANRTRGQNTVRVTADERLNAVLINAPANDVRAIKNLVAQLEGAKPANIVEIRYIALKSANAIETVGLIENVLMGRGVGGRRTARQATVLKYLRQISAQTERGMDSKDRGLAQGADQRLDGGVDQVLDEATSAGSGTADTFDSADPVEMEVSAAIRESITLTPDLRTNTIIVSAPRESMDMIVRMIRDLDESSTGSKNIRIFKLVNADAIAMAEILTELFQLRQGQSIYVLKPREEGIATAPVNAQATPSLGAETPAVAGATSLLSGTELTAVPDERQQLSITVDSRTNSLIVSGTPTYLDLVSNVVEELDKLEANEREVFVYQLRNSVAADVAKVIGEFVDQEQRKLVSTLSADQLGSAARLLEREITIQGDTQSNTVLVSASPRYMQRVKDMIRQLDVDPPQVLIQVMLAEVTLDSRDEWGVDLSVGGEIGGADVTAGFGLASTFVPGLGVPSLAIASSDFDLLIRAMKSQGRLQVLSNPSVMAANNAPARIQVGETIRLPVSTSITDAGRTFSTLEKEDIGVILEVTPNINPDGFVRMTITPEISSLSARTTQISPEFQSPIIIRRTADTTVTVHDGQTIVLGGLISDRFERRDRKVPVLGDIPVVGALFRSNTEDTAKTELLIVLTPHVIESPAEFDRIDSITDREIDRLTVPAEVKESIRRSLIDGTGGLYNSRGEKIELRTEENE